MSSIEQRVSEYLTPTLADALKQRTEIGIIKYGQRLDDNRQTDRKKAIHLVQELLDGAQYAEWLGHRQTVRVLCLEACSYQVAYNLTTAEIMAGGKS